MTRTHKRTGDGNGISTRILDLCRGIWHSRFSANLKLLVDLQLEVVVECQKLAFQDRPMRCANKDSKALISLIESAVSNF